MTKFNQFFQFIRFTTFLLTLTQTHNQLKVNKSVYIAKSKQQYHKRLNKILLHVSNHALKDMYMLNYGTVKKKTLYIIFPSRC